jgi:stage V sporulation protein D (sporulation-specific penicillin-binding protein)
VELAVRRSISAAKLSRTILQKRVRLTFVLLCVGYLALAARLAYLQIYEHQKFLHLANQIRLRTIVIPAVRGAVVDRDGAPLAISIDVGDIIADPKVVQYPEQTSEQLASALGLSPKQSLNLCNKIVESKVKRSKSGTLLRYLLLQPNTPYAQVTALRSVMAADERMYDKRPLDHPDYLAGISVALHQIRTYPNGDLAAQILGFPGRSPNGDFVASYGVESSQETALSGDNGSITTEVDDARTPIPGAAQKITPVMNGHDVALTIDVHIQEIAQRVLYNMVRLHHAQSGSVVVLDPKTGDILALANDPVFDPNNLAHTNYSEWDNRAVSDLYEPGSTLKTLTLAAVLDAEGLNAANRRVYCTGRMQVGNHIIHCAPDPPDYGVHGNEDMQDVLRNSCNIGASIYGMSLGAAKLYHYEKAFGLLDRPDCGLPGAQHSRLSDPSITPWPEIKLANVSFGQGISLTGLQLASVYATIANNGVRVFPHIVLGAKPPESPYQVVKPEVAQKMLTMLRAVVTDGTGKPAQIADYTVGGKTGSAQVAEHGHYGNKYVGSFCGIAPLNDPRLVVLCVINKPVGVHWGAVVAAPVVHDILQQALWYLKVPPDAPGQQDYSVLSKKRTVARPVRPRVYKAKTNRRYADANRIG